MTRNERIAQIMGWVRDKKSKCWINAETKTVECDPYFNPDKFIDHAKLLQTRLIDDGWRIDMTAEKHFDGKFDMFTFIATDKEEIRGTTMKSESTALAELFRKVYGIK